jgi:glycosyltransferase involved in cell wall biosynthesis
VSAERAGSLESVADPVGSDARPLRVLVVAVIAHGIGGMQRHTHDLVRGLVAAGHDVEVICPRADELAPDLYGARWHLVDTAGRPDPEWRKKFLQTYLALERDRFDVIHSESTAALPLMRLSGLPPVVIEYHGNYLGLARAHLRRMVTRPRTVLGEGKAMADMTLLHFRHRNSTAFRHCVSIVPSQQQVADTARSLFLSREQIHVVPNGIDPAVFAPGVGGTRAELDLPGDGVIFVGVGRLARDKGFDVAIEAFARVVPDAPNALLLVIGDGEERDNLEALVERLGVSHAVRTLGRQSHSSIAGYLTASDVFLFPTLRDEAAPLVLPEAMACGLPVVASRIGGITEVLDAAPGREASGLLLRPGNTDELAAAIRRLAVDADLRARLGRLALERFRAEYTLNRMIERTVDVYRIAVARGY